MQSLSFLAFFRCLNHLRHCSTTAVKISVCPLSLKVEYIAKRLTTFIRIFAPSLQSEHLHHRWKDLTPLDSTAQKSRSSDAKRASTCRPKFLHAVTSRHAPNCFLEHVSPSHHATSTLEASQP